MTGNGQESSGAKLSLAMIVRNCATDLDNCLQSIRKYVDETVIVDTEPGGSTDGTRAVAKMHNCRLEDFPWIDDFAAARNYAASKCSSDAVLWLDSDDVVENAATLTATAKGLMLSKTDCLYARYDYEWDAAGHCTTRLWRERVTDRRLFTWKAPIHECQIANFKYEAAHILPEYGSIRHTRKREDGEAARVRLVRNLDHLEKAAASGKMETRLLFYWGNTLVGLGCLREAIDKYSQYIQASGVPEEKYAAIMATSECYRSLKDYRASLQAIMQAVCFRPDLCSAYLHGAETYLATNNYADAERWAKEAIVHLPNSVSEIVYNPKAVEGRPHVILAVAAANQGRIEDAKQYMEKAKKYYPNDSDVQHLEDQIAHIHRKSTLEGSVSNLARQLKEEGRTDRLKFLAAAAPDYIAETGLIQSMLDKQRDHAKPTVAIYCPIQGEPWNPKAITERGIGGSEEAVINMARELTTRNWNVEVYAETEKPGDYGAFGRWYPMSAFGGTEDPVDATIWWRCPDGPINAGANTKVSYAWLHDTPVGPQWIPNYHDMLDRVMFLSTYHRSLFPWVHEDHVWHTSNGTDPALLAEPRNEPKKLIYASCPSRGLVYLLRWWSYLRDQVPDVTLDVYYGWNVWAKNSASNDARFGAIYQEIEKTKSQPGIAWRGRVPQQDLAAAMATSQIWAYPCPFPEISCITAMKMQQHGVMPITVGKRNALDETVQFGEKLDIEISDVVGQKIFIDAVIKHLKDPSLFTQRQEMIAWARKKFPWGSVADDWDRIMREDISRKDLRGERIVVQKGRVPRRALLTV